MLCFVDNKISNLKSSILNLPSLRNNGPFLGRTNINKAKRMFVSIYFVDAISRYSLIYTI